MVIRTSILWFLSFLLIGIFTGCRRPETCHEDYLLLAEEDKLSLAAIYNDQERLQPDSIVFGPADTISLFIDARMRLLNKAECFTSRMEIRHFGSMLKIETVGAFDAIHSSGSNIDAYCLVRSQYNTTYVKTVAVNRFSEFIKPAMPGFAILMIKRPEFHQLKLRIVNFNPGSSDSLVYITPELHFIF